MPPYSGDNIDYISPFNIKEKKTNFNTKLDVKKIVI